MELKFKHKFTHVSEMITSFVTAMNGFLGLSPREAEFLSLLMFHELNNSFGARHDIGDYYLRVHLKEVMKIKDSTLSAYYGALKDRGIIVRSEEDRKWRLADMFKVRFDEDEGFVIRVVYDLKIVESGGETTKES